MGLFNGKNHQQREARDPRPKGAQKGVIWRDHETVAGKQFAGKKTHTPWVSSKPVTPRKPVKGR